MLTIICDSKATQTKFACVYVILKSRQFHFLLFLLCRKSRLGPQLGTIEV